MPMWMRFVLAAMVLPFAFLTEAFLVLQWFHYIHVSWWWIVYTILADASNGYLFKMLVFKEK